MTFSCGQAEAMNWCPPRCAALKLIAGFDAPAMAGVTDAGVRATSAIPSVLVGAEQPGRAGCTLADE
jgi:hypothetical protein